MPERDEDSEEYEEEVVDATGERGAIITTAELVAAAPDMYALSASYSGENGDSTGDRGKGDEEEDVEEDDEEPNS